MLRRLFAIVLLASLTVCVVWLRDDGSRRNRSQQISFHPILLGPPGTRVDRAGELIFAGGWELQSQNTDFFGFSGLDVLPDGRLLTVTDSGSYAIFTPPGRERRAAIIRGIPSVANRGISKVDRDSESVTSDPASGLLWVGFEDSNSISRFLPNFARPDGSTRPQKMRDWQSNSGAETLLRLSDGRFLVLEEANPSHGLLFAGDPVADGQPVTEFTYRPPDGFRPTDAAQLPDGRILILNRNVTFKLGFETRVTIADPRAIRESEAWPSDTIARLQAPLSVDNFEGIATERREGGKPVIWLISDDNSSVLQRTLLFRFILDEQGVEPGFEAARQQ